MYKVRLSLCHQLTIKQKDMKNTMTFSIFDVASVVTGRLYCQDGIGGVYKILNFLCQESLMTHHLPPAADFVREKLLNQLPENVAKSLKKWKHSDDWATRLSVITPKDFELTPVDKTGFGDFMVENSLLLK